MALTMKERYARLNMSKLPDDYSKQLKVIEEQTDNFSDDDLNEVFAENFNDLYELVEKKYPEAITKGGTVKRAKPGKVKVVKPKAEKEPEEKREVKHTLAGRAKLYADEIEGIEAAIEEANVKGSSDKNLALYLAGNFSLSKNQAEKWVSQREKYKPNYASGDYKGKYSERTKSKKAARKDKDTVETRDGHKFNRKDPDMKGKKFFDENGKEWTCKRYSAKLDECIMEDKDGKEISTCLKDMYVNNPVTKRGKGDMVDECKEELKKAGYTVKEHKAGTKKVTRSEPRPERVIIKERVEDAFTPIIKDLKGSEEKEKDNEDVIALLKSLQGLCTKLLNRLNNMADDFNFEGLKKIEKLLKEIVD